ncbi:hypothetical protein VTL71DRAFT_2293 [Oculimacula yallundae]|uniref:CMP/dCMP-type deaminase domain-containing protein n=1 Tax=Oculimacula yallundae TaxID=86028 RepID=A0ABR4C981_9HELO
MSEMKRKRSSEGDHYLDGGFDKPAGVQIPSPKDVPLPKKPGVFVSLKTTLETRSREKIGKVYVTGVPAKQANAVLNLVRKLLPQDGGIDFQHLRRFAKLKDLPSHVCEMLANSSLTAELFLIAGPVSEIPSTDLLLALSSVIVDVKIVEVNVPMLAPTSREQALAWTAKYWPTVYKKSNPFGPHPSIVERAEDEMRGEVERYMDLAENVAVEASGDGGGEKVGVVVVERRDGQGRIVAVAGDSRWLSWDREGCGSGNIFAHAVMRAIGMVAGGLKAREDIGVVSDQNDTDLKEGITGFGTDAELNSSLPAAAESDRGIINTTLGSAESPKLSQSLFENPIDPLKKPSTSESNGIADIFKDEPLSTLEKQHYDPSGNENGYLCHELEIYCTHEPCVMCSMAIVHSRFGRVMFKRRMAETGGLCADGELGHGLFWRKELNWTLLGWQWLHEGDGKGKEWRLHA